MQASEKLERRSSAVMEVLAGEEGGAKEEEDTVGTDTQSSALQRREGHQRQKTPIVRELALAVQRHAAVSASLSWKVSLIALLAAAPAHCDPSFSS